MKKVALIASILILVAIGSLWLGYHIRNPALIRRGYCVTVTCGGGDYPNEAFRIVNDELGDKIDSMLGGYASQNNIVVVIPEISGYRVTIAGPSGTKLWDEGTERELREWIYRRMNEIQLEEQQMAEHAGTGQPATRPESKSEDNDKPQPEAEGRSR